MENVLNVIESQTEQISIKLHLIGKNNVTRMNKRILYEFLFFYLSSFEHVSVVKGLGFVYFCLTLCKNGLDHVCIVK
jgi:hypothetical protein